MAEVTEDIDILDDVSTLTTITYSALNKIMDKVALCISSSVYESTIKGENYTAMDIGIGSLCVKIVDGEILYKFVPSHRLNNMIKDVVNDKENPLINALENTLSEKILKTYKELL